MTACSLCHQEVAPEQSRAITAIGHDVFVHSSCFDDFAAMVKEATRGLGPEPTATGLDRLVRMMDGQHVLVHRNFQNEWMPLLAYLDVQKEKVLVTEMYEWAQRNEVHIYNPSDQVYKLKNRGLVSTYDNAGKRYIFITDEGRKVIEEYAASLTARPE